MAITDAEAAKLMAEQHPDLHESRQIAFGQNYLQDLEQGKGTAQYYTGFGLAPDWVTGAIGDPYKAPVVQEPTAGDAQVAEQIAAQDRDAGITGASVVQPTGGGAQNPLTQMITDPTTGQTQTVKQAMTQDAAYSLPGQSDPFLASGAAGGARLPATQYTTTLPSGDVFATDDPMLQEKMDYTEKTPAWWESARDKFVTTGQDVGGFFGDLKDKGIDVGKMAGSAIMNMIAPGLGFVTQLPISSASGAQQDLVRDQLVDSGVVLDDIGRIVQTGDYNTPENVMAGYTPGQTGLQIGGLKIGGGTVQHSAAERINDIQNTIDNLDENWSQLKESDPEAFEAKKQNLIDRQEALREFINMGAAEAAGGVRLEDWDPENKIAGEVVYGTDYFPELGQEDTAPIIIEDIDEGFQTRFTAKDDGTWKGPGEISGVAGKTTVDPDTYMGSTVEGGAALRGTIDRTQPTAPVTGVDAPPSILSPEIYQDPIMDIADERRALQEELEAYRDSIMDMVDPTGEINVEDLTTGQGPFLISAADALPDQTGTIEGLPPIFEGGEPTFGGTIEAQNMEEVLQATDGNLSTEDIRDLAATGDLDQVARTDANVAKAVDVLAEQYDRNPHRDPDPTTTSNVNKAKAMVGMPQMLGDVGQGTPVDRAPPGSTATKGRTGHPSGGDAPGGDRKIVCTMMNESYGFGSFRNKIWLKHSKDLAPEYQIGYHKIFLPLVKLSKTNKLLKKTLEHIAVHRTIDIRQEARGKVHLLGRIYRKILEPICYWVGKYA